ncbi:MAG TPA: EVE domain-containing protein [Candidatus Saccharimonadales bacterium]|nr:EVE domain-containing protein [Candidatus Saccharimonadales bacterium]
MKYFIGVVSKEHVMIGIELGIAQIGHGKRSGLARMHKGNYLIYYSPKIALDSNTHLQAFTALGQMTDDDIYQVTESPTFKPFRRKVKYEKVKDAPIAPLIGKLSFIKNKKSWGYIFRFGLVEISKEDFEIISKTMRI